MLFMLLLLMSLAVVSDNDLWLFWFLQGVPSEESSIKMFSGCFVG